MISDDVILEGGLGMMMVDDDGRKSDDEIKGRSLVSRQLQTNKQTTNLSYLKEIHCQRM